LEGCSSCRFIVGEVVDNLVHDFLGEFDSHIGRGVSTSMECDAEWSQGYSARNLDDYRWVRGITGSKHTSFRLDYVSGELQCTGNREMPLTQGVRSAVTRNCFAATAPIDLPVRKLANGNADQKNHQILPSKYSACMPKRPRPDSTDETEDSFSEVPFNDDQEPDIFAALTGQKKRRISGFEEQIPGESEDDEDLQDIIRQATTKRDVKEGTHVVKKVKGKTKITKGEVGGGSFQSMGEPNHPYRASSPGLRYSAQVSTRLCCVP
jgi:hypothetical protein